MFFYFVLLILIISLILITSSVADHDYRMEILKLSVQYYIVNPIDDDYFFMTIKNMIDFVTTNRRVSPLTGLPGNVQIQAEIKKRVLNKEDFAVVYLDLDNFKAYNDVYGFSNGDEIIKFSARTIVKHVHEIPNGDNFVGHIGGDDFIAVISQYDYPKLCQDIIKEFDEHIIDYYTEDDVDSLKDAMAGIDEEAVEEGFWADELENLIDDIES